MAEYNGVMVVAEVVEGRLGTIATELLGCGRGLADTLGQELSCLLAGSGVSDLAKDVIAFGADKVYVVDDDLLKEYRTDSYLLVADKVVRQAMPGILLLGQTSIGRDLAPRLAFKLGTALTTDCVELSIDPESKAMVMTKPVYGGNAQAIFTTESFPQMATVRPKSMSSLERDDARKGEVIAVEAGLDPAAIRTTVLERVQEEAEGINIEDANVVVAGGRGIGSLEGFQQLAELAAILKGAVGASRPPCDNEWAPVSCQIGLTGKIVSPDLYFAIGISGASQHMTGCLSSKTIVAINKDPEANIFRDASFGVVGDWKAILPTLSGKIKELLAD